MRLREEDEVGLCLVSKWGSPLTWIIPLGPVRQRSTSPRRLYLGWGQGPTPSTAFDDRMDSSPPSGFEPGSMTIGPQSPYQTSYHIPSRQLFFCKEITWMINPIHTILATIAYTSNHHYRKNKNITFTYSVSLIVWKT